ncbi:hypothetical protein AMELA_G00288220, partial [Ameiurus melas]
KKAHPRTTTNDKTGREQNSGRTELQHSKRTAGCSSVPKGEIVTVSVFSVILPYISRCVPLKIHTGLEQFVQGSLKHMPGNSAGDTMDLVPIHHRVQSHSMDSLEITISL